MGCASPAAHGAPITSVDATVFISTMYYSPAVWLCMRGAAPVVAATLLCWRCVVLQQVPSQTRRDARGSVVPPAATVDRLLLQRRQPRGQGRAARPRGRGGALDTSARLLLAARTVPSRCDCRAVPHTVTLHDVGPSVHLLLFRDRRVGLGRSCVGVMPASCCGAVCCCHCACVAASSRSRGRAHWCACGARWFDA